MWVVLATLALGGPGVPWPEGLEHGQSQRVCVTGIAVRNAILVEGRACEADFRDLPFHPPEGAAMTVEVCGVYTRLEQSCRFLAEPPTDARHPRLTGVATAIPPELVDAAPPSELRQVLATLGPGESRPNVVVNVRLNTTSKMLSSPDAMCTHDLDPESIPAVDPQATERRLLNLRDAKVQGTVVRSDEPWQLHQGMMGLREHLTSQCAFSGTSVLAATAVAPDQVLLVSPDPPELRCAGVQVLPRGEEGVWVARTEGRRPCVVTLGARTAELPPFGRVHCAVAGDALTCTKAERLPR